LAALLIFANETDAQESNNRRKYLPATLSAISASKEKLLAEIEAKDAADRARYLAAEAAPFIARWEADKAQAEADKAAAELRETESWLAQQQAMSSSLESLYASASGGYGGSGCSDAKSCIYDRESGNNPNATNGIGCYGIGQDCNGVLQSSCGANYACQDAYFNSYAADRYGSWEAAWSFWQANGWW